MEQNVLHLTDRFAGSAKMASRSIPQETMPAGGAICAIIVMTAVFWSGLALHLVLS